MPDIRELTLISAVNENPEFQFAVFPGHISIELCDRVLWRAGRTDLITMEIGLGFSEIAMKYGEIQYEDHCGRFYRASNAGDPTTFIKVQKTSDV